jgi:hypothetical protein
MIPGLLCSTVQYSSVQFSTVQYSSVQFSTVQYSSVQFSTVQYSTGTGTGTTLLFCIVQYSTVQYSRVQYSTVFSSMYSVQSSTQLCTAQRASVNMKRCTLYAVISKLYYSSYSISIYSIPRTENSKVCTVRFTNMQKMRFANTIILFILNY